jgi:hypothetical protein
MAQPTALLAPPTDLRGMAYRERGPQTSDFRRFSGVRWPHATVPQVTMDFEGVSNQTDPQTSNSDRRLGLDGTDFTCDIPEELEANRPTSQATMDFRGGNGKTSDENLADRSDPHGLDPAGERTSSK